MAFSCTSIMTTPPLVTLPAKDRVAGTILAAEVPHEVSGKSYPQQQPSPSIAFPRRSALTSLAVSIATALIPILPVEARTVKPETRRKIREKLDKMREQGDKAKQAEKIKPEEGKIKEPTPSLPFNTSTIPLVEATL